MTKPFTPCDDARNQVEQALRNSGRFSNISVASHPSPNGWMLQVTGNQPRFRLAGLSFGTLPFYLTITGNRHHQSYGGGVISTSSQPETGPERPLYVIWTVLDCEYLWMGTEFADLVAALLK